MIAPPLDLNPAPPAVEFAIALGDIPHDAAGVIVADVAAQLGARAPLGGPVAASVTHEGGTVALYLFPDRSLREQSEFSTGFSAGFYGGGAA